MPMLDISGVSKSYGATPVLRKINLAVEPGELMFLLGPSGCGKSTLLRIIAGLIKPDEGVITLNGRDITRLSPESRGTPMVFQNYALWPHLDAAENIAFGLKIRGEDRSAIRKTVEEMLAVVGMSEFIHRKVNELSGGQQQRIALARALALNGSILLLDEPLSNLDARLRDCMRAEIRRICKERRLTAVYVTHDRREALSVGDRIAVMKDGAILQLGTPRELYRRPATQFAAAFLGDADFLEASCLESDASSARFSTPVGELLADLNGQSCRPAAGDFCILMIRPEAVRLGVPASTPNSFICVLKDSMYLGESTFFSLNSGGTTIHANESAAPDRMQGTPLLCSVSPDHLAILPR